MKRDGSIQQATTCSSEGYDALSTPPRDSGVIVAREPRAQARIRMELSAQISTLDPNGDSSYTLTSAMTLDVADGGLGLKVDEVIEVGQRVVVEIELADGRWTERNGRVAWTSQDPTGSRFAGIQFDTVNEGFAKQATNEHD